MKNFLAPLLFAFLAAPAASETTFSIQVQKRGADVKAGVATLVADELLLTSARLTDAGDRYVISNAAGAQLLGSIVATDKVADLVLLSVRGLDGTSATLAAATSEAGRRVHLLLPANDRRVGMMHSAEERDGNRLYRFTAVAEDGEEGAPLMNNCDELMAVSQQPRRRGRSEDSHFGISGDLSSLTAFLTAQSVSFAVAADPCLSMEDKLAEAAKRQKALEEEQKALEEEQKALEEEKEQLSKQATEAEQKNQERLEKMEEENKKRRAENEAEIEKLNEERGNLQEQVDDKDALKEELEEELEKLERDQQMMILGGSILAVILVALGIVFFVRARSRKRVLQESDQELSAARSALARTTATFPDVVLAGRGPDEEEIRIKINGDALIRTEDGQLIGRSAANADYVLNDESISRQHARLRVEADRVTIEDLGSLNGTRLNGLDLSQGHPQALPEGATLALGDVTLVVHYLPEND